MFIMMLPAPAPPTGCIRLPASCLAPLQKQYSGTLTHTTKAFVCSASFYAHTMPCRSFLSLMMLQHALKPFLYLPLLLMLQLHPVRIVQLHHRRGDEQEPSQAHRRAAVRSPHHLHLHMHHDTSGRLDAPPSVSSSSGVDCAQGGQRTLFHWKCGLMTADRTTYTYTFVCV